MRLHNEEDRCNALEKITLTVFCPNRAQPIQVMAPFDETIHVVISTLVNNNCIEGGESYSAHIQTGDKLCPIDHFEKSLNDFNVNEEASLIVYKDSKASYQAPSGSAIPSGKTEDHKNDSEASQKDTSDSMTPSGKSEDHKSVDKTGLQDSQTHKISILERDDNFNWTTEEDIHPGGMPNDCKCCTHERWVNVHLGRGVQLTKENAGLKKDIKELQAYLERKKQAEWILLIASTFLTTGGLLANFHISGAILFTIIGIIITGINTFVSFRNKK